MLPALSAPASGTVLLDGAGTERLGVQVVEVELETTRCSKTYRLRLVNCLGFFLHWLAVNAVAETWSEDAVVANQVLCNFVQWMYSHQLPLWRARHTVLAVQTAYKHLKGHLGRSWEIVKTWQQKVPMTSRVPITEDLVRAMFTTALTCALREPGRAHLWIAFAVLLRVGFTGLLRPAEITKLRFVDIRLPKSAWEPFTAVLTLLEPKNKASLGQYQFVLLEDVGLVRWLVWLATDWPGSFKVWPSSHATFVKMFKECIDRLGLSRLRLTVGSLRPGGATSHFLRHRCIPTLRILGRWRVESSLEHYIQTVMAHLTYTELSDEERERITALGSVALAQWENPPLVPWTVVFGRQKQWQGAVAMQHRRSMLSSTIWQPRSTACVKSTLGR